jgi:hypothetical protein
LDFSFSVPRGGTYELIGALTKSTEGGVVDLLLDDEPLVTGVDLSGIRFETWPHRSWGLRTLSAGDHTLRIMVIGTNSRTNGSCFAWGLDYLALIPATKPAEPAVHKRNVETDNLH